MDYFFKILSLISVFLAFPGTKTILVNGLHANVTNPVLWTHLGESVELFCASGNTDSHSLNQCRWTRRLEEEKDFAETNRSIIVNFTDEVTDVGGDYSYFGSGMANGECGLRIKNISENQIGNWGCTLIGQDIWIGNISVLVYEKPLTPKIISEVNGINLSNISITEQGVNSTIICCTSGGKPIEETHLQFNYDGNAITERIHKEGNNGTISCIKWEYKFTTEDHGKSMDCIVTHPAFSNLETVQDSVTINVNFAPKIVRSGLTVDSSSDLITATVKDGLVKFSFILEGHPRPNITVKTKPKKESTTASILQFTTTQFILLPSKKFKITLEIELPKEKGNYSYIISVQNAYGSEDFATPLIVSPGPGEEGSSFWVMLIVGIVMSILFIAIAVYIVNWTAKRRGWCCYKNRIGKYPVAYSKNADLETNEYLNVPRGDEIQLYDEAYQRELDHFLNVLESELNYKFN